MDSSAWSNLPEELLAAIGKRLNGHPDILRFRAVCKSWRSSITLRDESYSNFPAKLPFPISCNDTVHPMRRGYFTLSHTSTYLIQPLEQPAAGAAYNSMLIRVRTGKNGKMYLLNPFYKEKPIGFSPKIFPKVLNLLDFKVTQVSRSYSMKFNERSSSKNKAPPLQDGYHLATPEEMKEADAVLVRRVVLSSSSNENDPVIFGTYNQGNLFIMRAGDRNWTVFDDIRQSRYVDVAIHKGRCYAVDTLGTLLVLTSSLQVLEAIPSPVTIKGQKYLIESSGDLFLVHCYLDPSCKHSSFGCCDYDSDTRIYVDLFKPDAGGHKFHFKVFKLNEGARDWDEVKNIEDRTLFAGEDNHFSVFGQDLAGSQGNYLYYKDTFHKWRITSTRYGRIQGLLPCEIGACNLEDGFGVPLECLPAGFADIFWPPPAWLSLTHLQTKIRNLNG